MKRSTFVHTYPRAQKPSLLFSLKSWQHPPESRCQDIDNPHCQWAYLNRCRKRLITFTNFVWTVKVPSHTIGCPIGLGLNARDGSPTPQKWSEKALSNRPRTLSRVFRVSVSQRQNESHLPRMTNSSTNQIVFHGLPSSIHLVLVSY